MEVSKYAGTEMKSRSDIQARRERTPVRGEEEEVSSGRGRGERSWAWTYSSQVASGHDSGSSDEGGSDISDNVSVQVRGDDNVKLLGLGDELHRRVVHNHLVKLDAGRLVLLGDLGARSEEESVSELHDVGLVDTRHFLQTARKVGEGEDEGVSSDT